MANLGVQRMLYKNDRFVPIKISSKSARLMFIGCQPGYIANRCHGCCCNTKRAKGGFAVPIPKDEQAYIKSEGGIIVDGLLQPKLGDLGCPFQDDRWLCKLHEGGRKPFGCWGSPFTINSNDTLVIKNRNKLFSCFKDKHRKRMPAYKVYKQSLVKLFGSDVADQIEEKLDSGIGDFFVSMPIENYKKLMFVHGVHKRIFKGGK